MPPESLQLDLEGCDGEAARVALGSHAVLLRALARERASALIACIGEVAAVSPFRHMVTPGGWKMSVAMTNCGSAGWVTDRRGYRYDGIDPDTREPWPMMPAAFAELAAEAASMVGFGGFQPDACLINRYVPGARLSLHQDRNERDFTQPIVSVSLGLPAVFLWGGQVRTMRAQRVPLLHGDVVAWGGPDRMTFHGVNTLAEGTHPMTGAVRYNLTFRRAL